MPKTTRANALSDPNLRSSNDDPFPGKAGDKELLELRHGIQIYRLHISHTYTAFYKIMGNRVFITEVTTIDQAHKKYKFLK
jgi:hypothetical protein